MPIFTAVFAENILQMRRIQPIISASNIEHYLNESAAEAAFFQHETK
jgi:hypothetical protein